MTPDRPKDSALIASPRFLMGLAAAAVMVLAGCEADEVLPGERLDLRADLTAPLDAVDPADTVRVQAVNRTAAISLPAPVVNANWPQKGGSAANRIADPALGAALTRIWSVDIGQGNTRRMRLTADPVVQGGQIFTLDSGATVSSFSTNGQRLWSRDLTPEGENEDDASGGGLAVSGNTLFVTSAFGRLVALDTATGGTRWVQELDSAASGAPTVSGDTVVLVSRDSRAWGIDATNGRVRWQLPGARSQSGIVGGSTPAIANNSAVLPFSSGQITTVALAGGQPIWSTTIAGQRLGPVFSRVLEVSGDPVIAGDTVYIGNSSGRTIAVGLTDGGRRWTVDEGTFSPVWVSGGSVFLVSDRNELLRLNAANGERIWGTELPLFQPVRRERRLKDVFVHYGPILAGGRLIVASDDGLLRGFSPVDGSLVSVFELGAAAARAPVVAGGTLYLVTADGVLHAFR
jgi:outer membrane protein assembly factor BamB